MEGSKQFIKETKVKKLEKARSLWNEDLAAELHRPVRRHFPRRRVEVKAIDDIWGADLVEMQEWSKVNKGYRYMLNIIDIFSRYAFSVPLLNKTGEATLAGFKKVVKESGRIPKRIWWDAGKEFYNKHMNEW